MLSSCVTSPSSSMIHSLSLHDALPILLPVSAAAPDGASLVEALTTSTAAVCLTGMLVVDTATYWSAFGEVVDRKSTRLNSSHVAISYAVFCLKIKQCGMTQLFHVHSLS